MCSVEDVHTLEGGVRKEASRRCVNLGARKPCAGLGLDGDKPFWKRSSMPGASPLTVTCPLRTLWAGHTVRLLSLQLLFCSHIKWKLCSKGNNADNLNSNHLYLGCGENSVTWGHGRYWCKCSKRKSGKEGGREEYKYTRKLHQFQETIDVHPKFSFRPHRSTP